MTLNGESSAFQGGPLREDANLSHCHAVHRTTQRCRGGHPLQECGHMNSTGYSYSSLANPERLVNFRACRPMPANQDEA